MGGEGGGRGGGRRRRQEVRVGEGKGWVREEGGGRGVGCEGWEGEGREGMKGG